MDIIGIDPGLKSGFAWVWAGEARTGHVMQVESAELDPIDTGIHLDAALHSLQQSGRLDNAVVVLEKFTITPKTATNSQAPWSLEVIGQSKWIVSRYLPDRDPLVKLQNPADAKTIMPNDRLREIGLWHRGGKGHAVDALRHVGLYLHRAGWLLPRGVVADAAQ